MPKHQWTSIAGAAALAAGIALPAHATPFFFSTGNPDGLMATASRPGPPAGPFQETESADDFMTTAPLTSLTGASFTGLLPIGLPLSQISTVGVEIYRLFPNDSTNPPSGNVPTRTNSPADNAFVTRDNGLIGGLSYNATVLSNVFLALNSVDSGIHPVPNQTTGGDGGVIGQEVRFDITFTTPIDLPADHYFFVPQVSLATLQHFLWLSAPKPIVPPGTPITPDLQTWIRNADLAPDWLRVGTDIVGGAPAPTFNAAFSLTGETTATAVPEPASLVLLASGLLIGFGWLRRRA